LKEGFQLLEGGSIEVGLVINEGKTKYMVAANTQNCSKPLAIEIGVYIFERVDSYTYLGSLVNGDNNVSEENTNRLLVANRSYFGLKSQFKSQLLSRKTKILIQGVPGGKVNILGGYNICHSKQKTLYERVSYSERFPR